MLADIFIYNEWDEIQSTKMHVETVLSEILRAILLKHIFQMSEDYFFDFVVVIIQNGRATPLIHS